MHLPEADLWLDPWDAKPYAFVSHAHADHFGRHESLLCSETTGFLLKKRFKVAEGRLLPTSFQVPLERNGFRLRLLPAGHIPGSAMLHVTRMSDHASLLYTGDFKMRRSRTAEPVNFLKADTLVMESTFGLPAYVLPNQLEVEAAVIRFVQDAFDDNETPVLLAYSLGKAQEALALLEEHGIPVLQHPKVAEMTRACREVGVMGLPEPVEFDGFAIPGHVVIAPPHALRGHLFKGLKSKRTAMLSGWAMQPGAKFRYQVDEMIALSDHADHPGLLECIQRVRPKQILTVHGFAKEFAAELRSRQMEAWCASGGDQLELSIQSFPAPRRGPARGPIHKRVICQLADFSDVCRLAGETGSRLAKIRFLASYLASLENDDDLKRAVNWLVSSRHKSWLDANTLRHTLLAIPGVENGNLWSKQSARHDVARCARLILQNLQLQPDTLDLATAAAFIHELDSSCGSMERIERLSKRLSTLHPSESEMMIRLITGDLQIGVDELLINETIATAFHAKVCELQSATRINSNLGETAVLARHHKLTDAQPPMFPAPENATNAAPNTTEALVFPENSKQP